MSTRIYSVPGISCEHCKRAIEAEVTTVPGVRSVEVDVEARTVTVAGEPLDEAAIVDAIGEAGYEVAG
ncbi:MAG TPA: heavy-metal-associated domain-containing protein [Gaiellaceae bacterium]|nr:heavy-metal-associated domain-containing protein [Gaiellaceae bacterium]